MIYSILLWSWLVPEDMIDRKIYIVGGTVRDFVMGFSSKDIDLVCKDAKKLAISIASRKNAALVSMEKKPEEPCYRVIDRSDPESFIDVAEMRGKSIQDDLAKRDFAINAMAIEVSKNGITNDIIDPFCGLDDIRKKVIRIIDRQSLKSDPLRILRAFRFVAYLGFKIDRFTQEVIKESARLLNTVSSERIASEIFLILKNCRSAEIFRQMDEFNILDVIFPEIRGMKGCMQNGYHHLDVWEHSLLVMENTEEIIENLKDYFKDSANHIASNFASDNRLLLLKFAALFHDVGKPATMGRDEKTGKIKFCGHDSKGAEIMDAIAKRLRISNQQRKILVMLVAEHLNVLNIINKCIMNEGALSTTLLKWFRKMKENAISAIILGMADVQGSKGTESTLEYRKKFVSTAYRIINDYYKTLKLAMEKPSLISGHDLILSGMEPGPKIRHILDMVRIAQDKGEVETKEEALSLARRLLK